MRTCPATLTGRICRIYVICAALVALAGCVFAPDGGDEHVPPDVRPDAGVDAAPVEPRLFLIRSGPLSGTEVPVGTQDAEALCIQTEATVQTEFRTFRLYVRAGDGLLMNARPQYRGFEVVDADGIVAGQFGIDPLGNGVEQTLVLSGRPATVGPDAPHTFCVRFDVNANELLHGHGFGLQLLPFQAGDIVLADGTPFPLEHIEPNTGFSYDFVIRGNVRPLVPETVPRVEPAPPVTGAFAEEGIFVFHSAFVTVPDNAAAAFAGKKLTYSVRLSTMFPGTVVIMNPQLWANGVQLPIEVARIGMNEETDCGFVASATDRCVTILLAEPYVIPIGASRKIELRMHAMAPFAVTGDTITTEIMRDAYGYQAGPLVGTGFDTHISGGQFDQFLWSNGTDWYHNGHHVGWGSPWTHVLTR